MTPGICLVRVRTIQSTRVIVGERRAPGDASSAAVTSKCVVVPFNKMLVHLRREEMTNHFVEWHHDELSDGLRALGLVEIEKRYSRPPCLCISVGR